MSECCSQCQAKLAEITDTLPNGEVMEQVVCMNPKCPLFEILKFKI